MKGRLQHPGRLFFPGRARYRCPRFQGGQSTSLPSPSLPLFSFMKQTTGGSTPPASCPGSNLHHVGTGQEKPRKTMEKKSTNSHNKPLLSKPPTCEQGLGKRPHLRQLPALFLCTVDTTALGIHNQVRQRAGEGGGKPGARTHLEGGGGQHGEAPLPACHQNQHSQRVCGPPHTARQAPPQLCPNPIPLRISMMEPLPIGFPSPNHPSTLASKHSMQIGLDDALQLDDCDTRRECLLTRSSH